MTLDEITKYPLRHTHHVVEGERADCGACRERWLLDAVQELRTAVRDEMALVEALIAKATKRAFAIPTDAHYRAKEVLARLDGAGKES